MPIVTGLVVWEHFKLCAEQSLRNNYHYKSVVWAQCSSLSEQTSGDHILMLLTMIHFHPYMNDWNTLPCLVCGHIHERFRSNLPKGKLFIMVTLYVTPLPTAASLALASPANPTLSTGYTPVEQAAMHRSVGRFMKTHKMSFSWRIHENGEWLPRFVPSCLWYLLWAITHLLHAFQVIRRAVIEKQLSLL